jgi:hypothetical protein
LQGLWKSWHQGWWKGMRRFDNKRKIENVEHDVDEIVSPFLLDFVFHSQASRFKTTKRQCHSYHIDKSIGVRKVSLNKSVQFFHVIPPVKCVLICLDGISPFKVSHDPPQIPCISSFAHDLRVGTNVNWIEVRKAVFLRLTSQETVKTSKLTCSSCEQYTSPPPAAA